ncbi:MAG: hypothetical protein HOE54_01710 [Gammaproteobacteria bacterium]|nr:hypothetical protein [Gammaproteobacteria bacterium]MBT7914010.1 hypothetical protein [Candidatus Bathyarchaeota archaeon]
MYEGLGHVVLAGGEQAEVGVVVGPDTRWAERLKKLLCHKGEPWNWQNSRVLRTNTGIGSRFYVLHRGGIPFANTMIAELSGVGILAHVWTRPEDREKRACSELMRVLMEDFRFRQGKALFLFTQFGSVAYRIYEKFGFRSVESQSGFMDWYATSKDEFEAPYFEEGATEIQPLGWTHWPSSPALFMGDFPGAVRCAPLKLIGRQSTQTPFLSLLRDEERRKTTDSRTLVLQSEETTAVVGFTAWDWHPRRKDTCLVDVYCHPNYWDQARNLLLSLPLPRAKRYVAYSDIDCEHKAKVLLEAGFSQTTLPKRRLPSTLAKKSLLDVSLFEKERLSNEK